jgi:hypothetical protein
MFGLAFVVVIMVFGIVLYLYFSSIPGTNVRPRQVYDDNFLTALSETDVPACGVTVTSLANDCVFRRSTCGGNPCGVLQGVFDTVTNLTLEQAGLNYNLSLEGSGVESVSRCNSSDPAVDLLSAPPHPILISGRNITLSICR